MPGIFISYRRSDNPDATGRIYDRLVAEFGRALVFKDIDSIPLGRDFRSHLNEIIGDCAAVLAIVGPRWTDARNDAGHRRLEDPDDFVRIELEAALARNIPVVPVLVGNALMPGSAQLPSTLEALAYRQSIEVRPDPDFHNDATRLVASLRRILDPSAPGVDDSSTESVPAARAAKRELQSHRRLVWISSVAAVAVVGMIAFAVPALKHLRETPPPETRLEIVTPATDRPEMFALSPDGRQIVFVASGDSASRLFLRSLAMTTAQPLDGTDGATYPFWSPDGRSVGFFAGGALKRLDLGGGAPQTLAPAAAGRGGAWSADGIILFGPSLGSPLMRVAAAGGNAVAITTLGPQQRSHRFPQFLPDGRRFLFYVQGEPDTAGVYLGVLDGSAPTRLTAADGAGVHVSSGWLLWVRAGTLMAQRLDLANAVLTGEAVTVAEGVVTDSRYRSAVSVAATGMVAYRTGGNSQRQLTWFDRSGTARGIIGDPDSTLFDPRVSPDGRRVVVNRTVQGNSDLWLLDGARTTRFTFGATTDMYPLWSPDGTRIVFRSVRSGAIGLYQKLANGTGVEERLGGVEERPPGAELSLMPTSWSVDGRFLMYQSTLPESKGDLWVVPTTGERTASVFLKTPFTEVWGAFSPDGRWVAYYSDESGRSEVYVRPFASGTTDKAAGGQWQVSTAGGIYPLWAPDGKELYFLSPAGDMMAAPINITGTALDSGAPARLFPTRMVGGGGDAQLGRQYDVAPDGRFLINTELDNAAAPITLIQNWHPEAAAQ
ncbi:MAG: TIR domain-containing protein [Steroidobacteraceae bacterium]